MQRYVINFVCNVIIFSEQAKLSLEGTLTKLHCTSSSLQWTGSERHINIAHLWDIDVVNGF